jgi:hypothetical protein
MFCGQVDAANRGPGGVGTYRQGDHGETEEPECAYEERRVEPALADIRLQSIPALSLASSGEGVKEKQTYDSIEA